MCSKKCQKAIFGLICSLSITALLLGEKIMDNTATGGGINEEKESADKQLEYTRYQV